ncbi:MAG: phosphotriesterase family protein [Bacillota bacterium]
MTFVRTLLGDIDPREMGVTYSHEHIVCRPPYWVAKGDDDLLLDDPAKSLADVELFARAGGRSIVDATCHDYGRDVEAVVQISRQAGVHVIGTAGLNKAFLWSARRPGHDETFGAWIERLSITELTRFVAAEVTEGLEGSPYRAGQVKFGTGYNTISPLEEKVLRAVARAHHETEAPVHSHTEVGTMALEQIDLLREEQVNLAHVSFGHMDRNPDTYYHLKIAETGAYLCFDGIGKVKYYPESVRIQCILELVKRGHERQILISGDTARKSYYRSYGHGLGLGYILEKWVPRFIDEAAHAGYDGHRLVRLFFEENPQRCFTFKKGA